MPKVTVFFGLRMQRTARKGNLAATTFVYLRNFINVTVMNKITISVVTMGVLALLMFSCNREKVQLSNEREISAQMEELIPSVETVLSENSGEFDLSVANDANPFDYVGLEHNKGLEKLLTENNAKGDESNDPIIHGQPLKDYVREKMTLIEFSKGYPSVVDSIKNAGVREGVSAILRHTREAKFNNVNELTVYLKAVDKKILAATFLNKYEKEQLLSMTSTFRYSVNFWHEHSNVVNLEDDFQKKRVWWEWLIIGAADAAGGFIAGSVPICGVGFNLWIAIQVSRYAGKLL